MSLTYNHPLKLLSLSSNGHGYIHLPSEPYSHATIGPLESATTFTASPYPDPNSPDKYLLEMANGNCLGRAQMEDLSLRPKSILSVPGINEGDCRVSVVEREYEGGFLVRVGNGRAVVIEDRVMASIVADEPPSSVFRAVYD